MSAGPLNCLGIVVHPTRDIDEPLGALQAWSEAHRVAVVQVATGRRLRDVAERGSAEQCGLIVAIGGDGTTLAAIRAAASADRPVLGVACGSLGALTSVEATEVVRALDRFAAGDWVAERLPALRVRRDGNEELVAFNDIVMIRAGEGQVRVGAYVDGTLFCRFAGDGCIVSTRVGSSAYALAAGGPLLARGAEAFLLTPLSVHGGACPPLVIGSGSELRLEVAVGHGGGRFEVDGQVADDRVVPVTATLRQAAATVVTFADHESFLSGLRRRQIIVDSPRIVAEDKREGEERDRAKRSPSGGR